MKTPANYFKDLMLAILFSFFVGLTAIYAQTNLPDSLISQSKVVDIGGTFRTGYATGFGHHTLNSFFKEPDGDEHIAYIDNYNLYYFKSTDNGNTWSKTQIITSHEGDMYNCALTVDTTGNVFIGFTVHNYFNYANPTSVGSGSEFLYDLYCVNNKTGSWVTELVNLHSSSNYGPRVAGMFVDSGNNVHILANYYGWMSYGGTAWEWIRNSVSNTWGTTRTIVQFSDITIDRLIYDTYTIVPDQQGNVTVVMCRNISTTNTQKPRLFYVRYNGTSWSSPVTITDAIAVAWNRFDAVVDTAGHTYIGYLEYKTANVPELKIMKDFQQAQTVSLNLAQGDTLNYFRLHCNSKGMFTMYLYLNTKIPKIKVAFSHNAVSWSDPIPVPDKLKNYMGGMIVKTNTMQGYFTDYCKQIGAKAGPRTAQPYGPDTLFYGSLRILGIPSTPVLITPANDAVITSQSVTFQWSASSPEVTEYRFEIDITPQFSSPFVVPSINGTNYLYNQLETGIYYWRVKAKNQRGWGEFGEPNRFNTTIVSVEEQEQLPARIVLSQSYPNPFNHKTTINWHSSVNTPVLIQIFDVTGKEVRTLVDENMAPGEYQLEFDATGLPAGVYFCKLTASKTIILKRLIKLR